MRRLAAAARLEGFDLVERLEALPVQVGFVAHDPVKRALLMAVVEYSVRGEGGHLTYSKKPA